MAGPEIHQHHSPNQGTRRGGITAPDVIVLHYTAMHSAEAAIDTLCCPEAEVSAHYVICKSGRITQLVDESARAWHAGAGRWAGCDDVNSRSIGIELDNDGASPFSEPLMAALERLLHSAQVRWRIPAQGIIAHSDLAPLRKIDPGPRFDWRRLALGGLAVWPSPDAGDQGGDLATSLSRIGYAVDAFGLDPCLAAFRARFRPQASGAPDGVDRACASDLAARFGVDRAATLA